jgi:molybdopterin molybdotransferase
LPAGRRLTPPDIGLAAALGLPTLTVRRRLRVGVFSTGDELVEPGQSLGAARTYDSNRFTLLALLQRLPVEGCDLGILPDDRDATASALRDAAATRVALSLELYRTHTKVCRLRTACMTWKSPGHLVGREGPGSS